MKLGEGGEAFFVFETSSAIPEGLQTSPLVSPATSPQAAPIATPSESSLLQDPEPLDLASDTQALAPLSTSSNTSDERALPFPDDRHLRSLREQSLPANIMRSASDDPRILSHMAASDFPSLDGEASIERSRTVRSSSPPPVSAAEAVARAANLSKKLWVSNIASQITETGDLKLDMTGYKSNEEEALRAEMIARKILSEEFEGAYDIGSLVGVDEHGNLWIYSSEERKEAAARQVELSLTAGALRSTDAISDPGYHSDDAQSDVGTEYAGTHLRRDSDSAIGLATPPKSPDATAGDPNRNYAKTLRLTSDQLKAMNLMPGENTISFSVNRAICTASIYFWRHEVPVVISDIDGTITK